ncbi:hypothetical protein LIER_36079 [Lithospermum erythrorhizon]|uniref:Trichome birefringence-like C-terminal domain-containing protein n=1 Tax=Lithospermum erythrorhizon TaxID=34254 RepID=A0AAV3P297_LITER
MLFLGDSVARNQLESLLCLLSQVPYPTEVENYDDDDNFRELLIKSHNFTIYFVRSTFLVQNVEIMENSNASTGSFNLHIDKVDERWAKILPAMDYAIIFDGNWFFRRNYLYEDGKLLGCVHCNDSNVTNLSLTFGITKIFRTALNFINSCKDCKSGLVTFLGTFSPAHFERGAWNSGGYCNKTSPSKRQLTLGGFDLEIRTAQVVDVTKAMIIRPDGHPNSHWGNQWNKGINDCLHWCLPGPIDLWNEFLLALLKKGVGLHLISRWLSIFHI